MPAKQRIKAAVSKVLGNCLTRNPSHRVVVLCYHSIHPSKKFASATPEQFAAHLTWLREHCTIIGFAQAMDAAKARESSRPAVAVTFDDGYADNYEYAFPLLQEYRVPATFFLTVGFIEEDAAVVQRFQLLRQSIYEDVLPLTWPQVRAMRKAGMEIGTHTYSHPNLGRLNRSSTQRELRRSKEVMEKRLGETVRMMAYPFGKPKLHFTKETESLAAEAGYNRAAAVLCRPVLASDSVFAIPRFLVARDSVETLARKVRGAWDFLGWWQERVPRAAARVISPEDFLH